MFLGKKRMTLRYRIGRQMALLRLSVPRSVLFRAQLLCGLDCNGDFDPCLAISVSAKFAVILYYREEDTFIRVTY